MKKGIIVFMFFLAVAVCAGDNPRRPVLDLGLSPYLGYYQYRVIENDAVFDGGLNCLAINYRHPVLSELYVRAGLEFAGHLYQGHEDSSHPVNRFWGLVNIKALAGFGYVQPFGEKFETNGDIGVFGIVYVQDIGEYWPGVGIQAKIQGLYWISGTKGFGLSVSASHSWHPGGEEPDMPSTERYAFTVTEISLGLVFTMKL